MSVRKDLGMVTAYAYALSKGYAGTEEQFATLMASYADVGQAAVDAALAAKASEDAAKASEIASAASATAAEGFAGNASTAAGNASQAAQNASQSATAASGSATAAGQSATAAAGSATTAGNKATEAAQSATQAAGSATTAGTAATNAQAAQTAAETAQTAAEDAQAAAEAAAQTLVIDPTLTQANQAAEAKATGDAISLVKSHLNAISVVDTASGAIASFADGADGVPVESLTVDLEPIQNLNGQDAPYPAGGGVNRWDEECETGAYNINGKSWGEGYWRVVNPIDVVPGQSYYLVRPSSITVYTYGYDTDMGNGVSLSLISNTLTIPEGVYKVGFFFLKSEYGETYKHDISFNYPSSVTTYSPYSNICPISGRQSVTVVRSGVNVWDEEWELGYYQNNGTLAASNNRIRCKNRIYVKPSTSYYVNASTNNYELYVLIYDANGTYINKSLIRNNAFTTSANAHSILFFVVGLTTYNHDISINYPATDTDYHPGHVQSVTIPLGQTVYGGTVDVVNGEMVVEWAELDMGAQNYTYDATYTRFITNILSPKMIDSALRTIPMKCEMFQTVSDGRQISQVPNNAIYNGATSSYNVKTDMTTDPAAFKQMVSGIKLVYPLATPLTVQLVGQSLNTLKGVNNIWSDGGDVTVDYVADTKLFIEQLTTPDADMVADANITSGSYFMVGNTLYKATANIANGAAIVPGTNCTRKSLAEALNEINA